MFSRTWISLALALLVQLPITGAANAQEAFNFETGSMKVPIGGRQFKLAVHIFRPTGAGPFPLVVINHGTPVSVADAPPPGVIGIISFAGGRGGDDHEHICSGADRLVQAARAFGEANQVPQLWLYAVNDHFFPPGIAHRLFDAYKSGSKPSVRFVELPPFDDDGHKTLGYADPVVWADPVASFLTDVQKPSPPGR